MNNSEFRRIVLDTPSRQPNATTTPSSTLPSATPSALGRTKRTSLIPMTPRHISSSSSTLDFARQLRDRNASLRPTKKFKSSAPKGVKYGAGYIDRAKAREENSGELDEREGRIKALEEQWKLGQIEREVFEALRDTILGEAGVESSHLVKGLDWKLLERVRRGEDVLGGEKEEEEEEEGVEDELDRVVEKEVEAVKRATEAKKGTMAPPSLLPQKAGVKRSRDALMAELKAQRQAAAEAKAKAELGKGWRKVGVQQKSRIEVDHKGREVMITVDEDGVVKKKVRKAAPTAEQGLVTDMPDESKPVLGADTAVPVQAPVVVPEPADEDDDIFEGVGVAYNPLGEEDDEDDSDDEDTASTAQSKATLEESARPPLEEISAQEPVTDIDEREIEEDNATTTTPPTINNTPTDPIPNTLPAPEPAPTRRNYFNDPTTSTATATPSDRFKGIENVLKKASKLDPLTDASAETAAEAAKHAKMLAAQDRDMDDMDFGFGSSRVEDEAEGEGEGKKGGLSEWKGGNGGWDEEGKEGKGGKDGKERGPRKRKPKKRKGDGENAADVLRVIEGRRKGGEGEK